MDYIKDFVESRYHLIIAERMIETYSEFPEKRFLIGIINEAAKSASRLIRAFLIRENVRKGNLRKFVENVAPKYMNKYDIENLLKILEVERAQKISRIEFAKDDKIILLIDGKYRILTASRLIEFVKSIRSVISEFSANIKR